MASIKKKEFKSPLSDPDVKKRKSILSSSSMLASTAGAATLGTAIAGPVGAVVGAVLFYVLGCYFFVASKRGWPTKEG